MNGEQLSPLINRLKNKIRRMISKQQAQVVVEFVNQKTITTLNGSTILEIAKINGVDISHYCGGVCSCGTCRVHVQSGINSLSKLSAREELVLGHNLSKNNNRLACQARVVGTEKVTIKVPTIY